MTDCITLLPFLSPEQKGEETTFTLTVGDMLSLTRLLGGLGLSDFQRLGCSRADIERLVDLHTDLLFDLTDMFGTSIVNAELA